MSIETIFDRSQALLHEGIITKLHEYQMYRDLTAEEEQYLKIAVMRLALLPSSREAVDTHKV